MSVRSSWPSRERSPTPANTEIPRYFSTMAWINSMTSTVLPTPAPPNSAALPPWESGARRSITLMPVSNIAAFETSSSSAGGGLWMPRSGQSRGSAGPRSRTAPTTSRRRPKIASPTGTEIGVPVARTGVLRARPAVAWSATPRIVIGSIWLCTSRTSASGRSHSTSKAVLIGGKVWSSKRTSSTAPRTDTTVAVGSTEFIEGLDERISM